MVDKLLKHLFDSKFKNQTSHWDEHKGTLEIDSQINWMRDKRAIIIHRVHVISKLVRFSSAGDWNFRLGMAGKRAL